MNEAYVCRWHTVRRRSDDLKNDGKMFNERMEQFAERRMAREKRASAGSSGDAATSRLRAMGPLTDEEGDAVAGDEKEYEDENLDYDSWEDDVYEDEEDEVRRTAPLAADILTNISSGYRGCTTANGGRWKNVSNTRCPYV